jgi:sarcosine oxidase subunit alpha
LNRENIVITIDGAPSEVLEGVTVLAALFDHGASACRTAVSGENRFGICGMGVCFECRVTIDGLGHQRACMVTCQDGMEILTGG